MNTKKILILGATGMLGHALTLLFSQNEKFRTYATVRQNKLPEQIASKCAQVIEVDVLDTERLSEVIASVKPDYVLNCVGLIKQLEESKKPIPLIKINS